MTKQEILYCFRDINEAYNDSSRYDSLSRMLDELLKEQEIVRCKDCKHRTLRVCNNLEFWECNHLRYEIVKCGVTDDWFCADGERRPAP